MSLDSLADIPRRAFLVGGAFCEGALAADME